MLLIIKQINYYLYRIYAMKKMILILAVILPIIFVGCSEDEEVFIETEVIETPLYRYYSADSLYYVNTYSTSAMMRVFKVGSNDYLYEIPLKELGYEEIDLGYGEIKKVPYGPYGGKFLANTHQVFVCYYAASFTCIFLYDEKGHEIATTGKVKDLVSDLAECGWNKNCMIGFVTDSSHNNVEEVYQFYADGHYDIFQCKGMAFRSEQLAGTWTQIDEEHYIVYDENNVCFFTLEQKSITYYAKTDIEEVVESYYPNEERAPRYTINSVFVNETTCGINIDITLYSGKKETIQILFNNVTGEIVK